MVRLRMLNKEDYSRTLTPVVISDFQSGNVQFSLTIRSFTYMGIGRVNITRELGVHSDVRVLLYIFTNLSKLFEEIVLEYFNDGPWIFAY